MDELRYTLVTEGSSDRALMPILNWMLQESGISGAIQGEWADLSWTPIPEKITLVVKIREAVRLYPCDLLFVHRDADRTSREKRVAEIEAALAEVTASGVDAWEEQMPPAVCVVPVRMQEAWLLIDEMAIRHAAGNKNGQVPLELPPLSQLESVPDPKQKLYHLLKQASELSGRRLKKFRPNEYAWQVGEHIEDFSPLRNLSAFVALENELRETIEEQMENS